MTIDPKSSLQISDPSATRTQYAALCWRAGREGIEVLLITSRDTGRWVIPKGWPIDGLSPEASAAREAWEEAGVQGQPDAHCLGLYSYDKGLGRGEGPKRETVPCVVAVYPLQVSALASSFPEEKQRRRKWFPPRKAARKVAEPELQALLADLDRQSLAQGKSKPARRA
ncbi:NUDIX hydrolase [Gemmobacter lutimaris]|uniref:NUDIX hydrolase n=1 Tax=Gemmobacter lutimaris TaxID=2306023 RepID=UPI001F3FDB21|nr:NUDIX hydrolase [Gemmobacter lutimaris]